MVTDIILKYFPDLTDVQIDRLSSLNNLYRSWNEKVNLISRKDIDNLYLHHILHSLSIIKFYRFPLGSSILDLGTGGGFPGVPLAILYESSQFTLIDGKKKKINVVNDIISELKLKNAKAQSVRAEDLKLKFDYVIVRAVATIDKLKLWSFPLIKKNNNYPGSGLFAYKGGNIHDELQLLKGKQHIELNNIYDVIDDEYYKDKYIVYLAY